MRYFLLDKIIAFEKGVIAKGIKCISLSEEILHDHFPDIPIMPGALLIEAAAQLGSFLYELTINAENDKLIRRSILAQVDKAKFNRAVEPGDKVILTAKLVETTVNSTKCDVLLEIENKKVSTMTLTLISKYIDSERIHEQRKYLYHLWTKDLNPKPYII